MPGSSMDQIRDDRDDPSKPLCLDSDGSKGQGMYGRDGPSVPTSPKPSDPTRPMFSGSLCVDS